MGSSKWSSLSIALRQAKCSRLVWSDLVLLVSPNGFSEFPPFESQKSCLRRQTTDGLVPAAFPPSKRLRNTSGHPYTDVHVLLQHQVMHTSHDRIRSPKQSTPSAVLGSKSASTTYNTYQARSSFSQTQTQIHQEILQRSYSFPLQV